MPGKLPALLRLALAGWSLTSCSGVDEAPAPCEIEALDIRFSGTLEGSTGEFVLNAAMMWSADVLPPAQFDYLAEVLGLGADTGPATAAWSLIAPPHDAIMGFQLGGARTKGSVLALLGVTAQGVSPGRGPPLSALPVNGVILQMRIEEFQAVSGTGTLTVQSAVPLKGTLQAELQDAASESRTLSGQLTVEVIGPGCN